MRRVVFLSSTGKDLHDYREAVIAHLAKLDHFLCDAQENFGARDASAVPFCRERVRDADIYVGLIGQYRGWEPPDDPAGWNRLGQLQLRIGDLDAAVRSFERVLALGNQAADQTLVAAATGNLGVLYSTRGDLDQAEAMYKKSLEIDEALGRKEYIANQYGNLGILYEQKGDMAAACAHWH